MTACGPGACLALGFALVANPTGNLLAWGPEGHTAVGIMSMELLDPVARRQLDAILGSTDDALMADLCNWPDELRDQPGWDWAAPQHYVNIPRSEENYDQARDCPGGLCVTEAVKKYAGQLGDGRLPPEQREQAFAWLCHLVGDLHQPLHCGFADDRGGNTVMVVFGGTEMNLHEFWDRQLILQQAGSLAGLLALTEPALPRNTQSTWNPAEVELWTDESHALAAVSAYPPSPTIKPGFTAPSWLLIQQRLVLAAERLAAIINATLGDGEVILDR